MSTELAREVVCADLSSARFRVGCARRHWRLVDEDFPVVLIAVIALPGHQRLIEYGFRFELTNFPTQAPEVKIWDIAKGASLPIGDRPKGTTLIVDAFKDGWPGAGAPSVYRPWERHGITHSNWIATHPHLTWNAGRDLAFVLEDLHALINSSASQLAAA